MSVTKLTSDAALSKYASTNGNAWYLGMRQEVRICQRAQFGMVLDKFDHRLHACYAVPNENELGALVEIAMNEGRGRPYSRGFRSPQVVSAFKAHSVTLTADSRIGSGFAPRGRRPTPVSQPELSPLEQLAALKAEQAEHDKRIAEEKAEQERKIAELSAAANAQADEAIAKAAEMLKAAEQAKAMLNGGMPTEPTVPAPGADGQSHVSVVDSGTAPASDGKSETRQHSRR